MVGCATRILEAVAPDLELVPADIGMEARAKHGSSLPDQTLALMRECESSLFGAVTSQPGQEYESPVLAFRKDLDLFANVRPIRSLVTSPLRRHIDVVIVRENSEGLYHQREAVDDDGVTTHRRVSRRASERIVNLAFDYAVDHGRSSVCCVHKANVLRRSDGLFLDVFRDIADARGKAVRTTDNLVDSAALLLVTDPSRFDVIVTLNLYGDILSDVAAGVAGGLGFAPSGNIGPRHSVFEPSHGSAPDIEGKGVANPTATILAAAMMLEHIGLVSEAANVRQAVESAYAAGNLTFDVGGDLGSEGFTGRVLERLRA